MERKKIFFKLAFNCALLAAGLFLFRAGFNWPAGWLYLGLYALWSFANAALLARRSPALLAARLAETPEPLPGWDKVLSYAAGAFYVGLLAACAAFPYWPWRGLWPEARWLGFAGLAAAYALASWALACNPFAVKSVSVAPGQRPVSAGPYRLVRHPLYAAFALHCLCAPAALGSLKGYLPAAGAALAMLGRAKFEDAFLRRELGGYAAYAQSVRYLAVPWLW